MCIQSYYNYRRQNNTELELDLVAEIKRVGIDKWNRREYQKYVNTSDKMLKEINEMRLKLSRKLSKMNSQRQLAYFTNASNNKAMIIQDSGKTKYKAKK